MLLRKLAAQTLAPNRHHAPDIAAYVIGPSGAGKSTYVKKNYPADRFFILHSDRYADKNIDGTVNIDWKRGLFDGAASGKPIVIDSYHVNRYLMSLAKDKILLDPGRVKTLAQLIGRRHGTHKTSWKHSPNDKLERFNLKARKVAEELGFVTKTAAIRSLAHVLTER
jgi:predicted kinase